MAKSQLNLDSLIEDGEEKPTNTGIPQRGATTKAKLRRKRATKPEAGREHAMTVKLSDETYKLLMLKKVELGPGTSGQAIMREAIEDWLERNPVEI